MEAEKTFEDIDGNEQPELDEEVVHYVVSQQVIVCDDTSNSTGKHSGQSADSTTNKLTNGTSSSAAVAVAD